MDYIITTDEVCYLVCRLGMRFKHEYNYNYNDVNGTELGNYMSRLRRVICLEMPEKLKSFMSFNNILYAVSIPCTMCRNNLPCTICEIKTPFDIYKYNSVNRFVHSCRGGRHICLSCAIKR